jgi:hypothetical protein
MIAPELHARLDAAQAVLADYRRLDAGEAINASGIVDRQTAASRLAAELELVCNGLWSALSELESADIVLTAQEISGLITTGAVSVSVDDTPTVIAALADATVYRSGLGDRGQALAYQDLAGRLRGDLPSGGTDAPDRGRPDLNGWELTVRQALRDGIRYHQARAARESASQIGLYRAVARHFGVYLGDDL